MVTTTGFDEGCCWTWIRDHCRDAERCTCACHTVYPTPAPTCGHEAEIERYRQKSRDEDTARIRLNHERIKAQELVALLREKIKAFVEHHDNGQAGQPGHPKTYAEEDAWQAEWDRRYAALKEI
jgi:hypothetical protein